MHTIPISKIEETREVDESRLSEEVKAFVFEHGLKQLLNDAHSGMSLDKPHATIKVKGDDGEETAWQPTEDDIRSAVDKKLQALYEGQVRRGGGGGGPRLSAFDRAWRAVAQEALIRTGLNATESAKLARSPTEAVSEYVARIAQAQNRKPTAKAMDNVRHLWDTKAEARVRETAEAEDIFG